MVCGFSNQPGPYGHESATRPPLTVAPVSSTVKPPTVPPDTVPATIAAWSSMRAFALTVPPRTAASGPTNAPWATFAFDATQPPPFDHRIPFADGFGAFGWNPSGEAPSICTMY